MSLTSHLKNKRSPVYQWFAEHFPNTGRLATAANRQMRNGRAVDDCLVPGLPGADASMVGTAVDYLLRACLLPGALDAQRSGSYGAWMLDQRPEIDGRAGRAERDIIDRIAHLDPCRRTLDTDEWLKLCRMCLVLTRFEQVFRTRGAPNVVGYALEAFGKVAGDEIDELAVAFTTPATVDDLALLGRAAVEDHADLKTTEPLIPNPVFEQSIELGGADADMIAGGTLLDFKSRASAGIVGRLELWQLMGYAFADTQDYYKIDSVAISALRWRSRPTWQLVELLEALGAPDRPLSDWRLDFAAIIPPL